MSDDFISKVTETGVDTIDYSFGVRHHFLDDLSAFLYIFPGLRGEIDLIILLDDRLKDLRGEGFSIYVE